MRYGMAGMYYSCTGRPYCRRYSMWRLYHYRCMGRLYCVLGCPRLYGYAYRAHRYTHQYGYGYSCTAAVGGAMAPMLPPYSRAPYICRAVYGLCVCVRAY